MGRPRKVKTAEEEREYLSRRKEQYRLSLERRKQDPINAATNASVCDKDGKKMTSVYHSDHKAVMNVVVQ